jgi:hypothetical protein
VTIRSRILFPPVERIEKVAKTVEQPLFHHGLVHGPKNSAQMGLLLAVDFTGHGLTPDVHR